MVVAMPVRIGVASQSLFCANRARDSKIAGVLVVTLAIDWMRKKAAGTALAYGRDRVRKGEAMILRTWPRVLRKQQTEETQETQQTHPLIIQH